MRKSTPTASLLECTYVHPNYSISSDLHNPISDVTPTAFSEMSQSNIIVSICEKENRRGLCVGGGKLRQDKMSIP
jgi:hypothetical protein